MKIEAVLVGGLSGLFIAGAGYFKSNQEEDFEPIKFSTTVVIGGLAGAFVGFTGMTQDATMIFLTSAGITQLVESSIKAIWRNLLG